MSASDPETTSSSSPNSIYITHSDIAQFLACRRKWAWSFVHDFQRPEKQYGALALGTRVHACLEEQYRDGADPLVVHERLAKEAVAKAEAQGERYIDQVYDDIIVSRNCILAHQDWLETSGEDALYETVAVEQKVEAPLLDGQVMLRGKVDLIQRRIDTGGIVSVDWKTQGNYWGGQREKLERSYQHHVYLTILLGMQAEGRLAPEDFIEGAHYVVIKKVKNLAKTTTPLVERFRAPATLRLAKTKKAQIEQICKEMIRTMESLELEGSSLAYPTPQGECRFCDFKHPCEIADESPLAARAMLDAEFSRGGRHTRYAGSTVPVTLS